MSYGIGAANTYFPIPKMSDSNCSDGGTWANSPSIAAATEAIKGRQNNKVKDLANLNLGTILHKQNLGTSSTSLGSLRWLQEGIKDIFLDGGAIVEQANSQLETAANDLRELELDINVVLSYFFSGWP